jgi:CDP-glycerol glycerophosphotransferase (TagB/SpsB family)
MTLSYYILKYPYSLLWKLLKKNNEIAYYCDNELDLEILRNINIPGAFYIARNAKIARIIKKNKLKVKKWPAFPQTVIMARHAFHRFPSKEIIKIGLRHGPYHFKKMISKEKYDAFDLFLLTSKTELEKAINLGFKNVVVGGYPKLDSFFLPETAAESKELFHKWHLLPERKNLLFSATWDRSGLSAIDRWIDRIGSLTNSFNVLVTLHPKMSSHYRRKLQKIEGIRFVPSGDLTACMVLADYLICDTSSIIGEFCALNKPIITFRMEAKNRLTPEITEMISRISLQIDHFDELISAIGDYIRNPQLKQKERDYFNKIIFDDLDVKQGKKAEMRILDFLRQKGVIV